MRFYFFFKRLNKYFYPGYTKGIMEYRVKYFINPTTFSFTLYRFNDNQTISFHDDFAIYHSEIYYGWSDRKEMKMILKDIDFCIKNIK